MVTTHPRILVLGGGITGQLAQYVIHYAKVVDAGPASKKLTRVWGTNYLWEPIDGIRCSSFPVLTHVDGEPASLESVARYKAKVGKQNEPALGWERQFKTTMTGWNFDEPIPCTIEFDKAAVSLDPEQHTVRWFDHSEDTYDILINTIPMPHLLALMSQSNLGKNVTRWTNGMFTHLPIYIRIQPRPLDAKYPLETLYVNYLSDPAQVAYRYCDKGHERHYEGLTNMGTIPNKRLVPGKIQDLPFHVSRYIYDEFESYGIYSFGRYARWQSDELVHETYRDLKLFAKEQGL